MGKMFDSADRLRSTLLKPPKPRSTTGQSRSGPISSDSAPKRYSLLSHKLDSSEQETKTNTTSKRVSSLWSWSTKVVGVFHHSRPFRCIFSIHIHSIQDLPPYLFHNMLLEVHCLRKGRVLAKTLASRALHGSVEFEETLHLPSNVRASRHHPHTVKHPVSKSFKLVVVASDDRAALGELTLDLGSILPCAIADTDDYASEDAWTSAFKLAGSEILRGATVVASMGYEFVTSDNNNNNNNNRQSQSGLKTGSCRFTKTETTSTSASIFWRRIRPLSGLVNVPGSLFSRSESLRSMPDLTGLAQEVCSSTSESVNGEEEDVGDVVVNTGDEVNGLITGSDRRLDNMLCSLVNQQRQSSGVQDKPMVQEPVELSKEEFSMGESTTYNSSEEDDMDVVAEKTRGAVALQLANLEVSSVGTNSPSSSEVNIYDEADVVTRQFLKMLESAGEQDRLEPLGSPVYEGNWILATIPEEEGEEEVACIPIAGPVPKLETSCYAPPVDAVDLHAFVPTWRKEDDLDLVSIMEAAECELQKVTQDTTNKVERRAQQVMKRNQFEMESSWRKPEESFIHIPPRLPSSVREGW